MAELQKVFIYVPESAETAWSGTYLSNDEPTEGAKSTYKNKIVFLEGTHRILVNGVFYGVNPTEMDAIDAAIEALEDLIGTEAKDVATDTGVTGATSIADAIKKIIGLLGYTSGDKVTENGEPSTSLKDYVDKAKDEAEKTAVAEAAKVEAKLPVVTSNTGSGISVTTATDSAGKVTYTVTADQRIWEFMGTAEADTENAVTGVLNGKYTADDAEEKLGRTAPENGDVWSVTVNGKTTLRAYSNNTWVTIGSANGIVDVAAFNSYGVSLNNVSGIVTLNITPGAVAADGTGAALVTGTAVHTAIEAAKTYSCTYAYNTATEVANAVAESYTGRVWVNGKQVTPTTSKDKYEVTVYAGDILIGGDGADKDVDLASAYAGIKQAIEAAVAGNATVAIAEDSTSYMTVAYTGSAYTIGLTAYAIHNYVVDNLWETWTK